jgi:type VI secretion system protein ImpL
MDYRDEPGNDAGGGPVDKAVRMRNWLGIIFSVIGVCALAALIWFAGPLVAVADVRPLASFWLRIVIILLLFTALFGYIAYKLYKRHKAARELEAAITESAEPDSDAEVLSERMKDALLTLKKSRKTRGDFLYELPWYIIIGPPGAGKTTALVNSGLKFPLAKGSSASAMAGVGGTRYCDWWFTDEAVLIDTAGRYTTQDSDASADRKSWLSFLDLLKKDRPKQPINGVMVVISLADLMTLDQAEITAHATAVRKRLTELHDQLEVDFPVYAIFTKADLVSGFIEYFGNFSEARRRMVWGATFDTDDKSRNMIGEAPTEFDLLISRLSEELPDRLQEEPDPIARTKLYGFPAQMAALKQAVTGFLNEVFEPTRYHTKFALRGFYFTSGTQEGTPIDRVIGAMSSSFGRGMVEPSAYSGMAKSFFLGDLLTKVIFGEAGWVSFNPKAVKRDMILRYGAFSLIGIVFLGIAGAWWVSYLANRKLITDSELEVAQYRALAEPLMQEPVVADTDFMSTLDVLHKLKHVPVGYGFKNFETPWSHTFGLSQRERLLSSSTAAYRMAMERIFRSRLILHVEKQIETNRNDPEFLYEALKVYLMFGGGPNVPVDKDLIMSWMRQDWEENLYPGAANRRPREELLQHLEAMLDLDTGGQPTISLNGSLVEDVQRLLVSQRLETRAYGFIKSFARTSLIEDWIASARAGPEGEAVFETKDGRDLASIRVPNLYTYTGFHELFLGQLETIADQLEQERWVLGKAGELEAVEREYGRLGPALLDAYARDFIDTWRQALDNLKLKSLASGRPNYPTLRAASGTTSPIMMLFESVRDETILTQEREVPQQDRTAGSETAERAGSALYSRYQSRLPALSRIGIDIAMKSQQRAGAPSATQVPGANIEAYFRRFHQLAEGDPGQRPIDQLVDNLNGIYQNLTAAASNPNLAVTATQQVHQQVAALRANASRLPDPLSSMMLAAADEFEGDAASTTAGELNQQLNNRVTRACREIIENRYPFAEGSNREVPLQEFARLFGAGGIIDRFFNENLAQLVDTSGEEWVWRADTRLGRELSAAALRQFQNAAKIREAFFPSGGSLPNINLTVIPLTLSQNASAAEFEVNGRKLESVHRIDSPMDFAWPGSSLDGTASIRILPEFPDRSSSIGFRGSWALYRLLNAGRMSRSGDTLSVRYVLGGREVSYRIRIGSLADPFSLPALRAFRCPAGLL